MKVIRCLNLTVCVKLCNMFLVFNISIPFSGSSTAVSIPNTVLDHNLPSTFTIATWLRHGQQQGQDKHMKEHILCTADDHSKCTHLFYILILITLERLNLKFKFYIF